MPYGLLRCRHISISFFLRSATGTVSVARTKRLLIAAPFAPKLPGKRALPLEPENPGSGCRASIARGQTLFNSKPINITGVAGLNDDLGLASIPGTCGTCHDSPNVGNHSVSAPLNIGVGDLNSPLDVSYL